MADGVTTGDGAASPSSAAATPMKPADSPPARPAAAATNGSSAKMSNEEFLRSKMMRARYQASGNDRRASPFPEIGRASKFFQSYFSRQHAVLPFAAMFGLAAMAYSVYWSQKQHDNPVCIDCVRQKEIVNEVYFSERPAMSQVKVARSLA